MNGVSIEVTPHDMYEDYALVPEAVRALRDSRTALAGQSIREIMGDKLFEVYEQLNGKDFIIQPDA